MVVTGTLIVTAPVSDSDAAGPRVRILEPLALDRRVTEVLMEGGGALPVYRCDETARCLNPTLGTATVPPDRGFRAARRGTAARPRRRGADGHGPAAGGAGSREPHHAAGVPGRERGGGLPGRGDRPGDGRARRGRGAGRDAGLDHGPAPHGRGKRAGTLDIADGEQLRRWREGLRTNRVALARHRNQGLQRLNTALAVVEKLRLIETELAGALSADLRAALAFARGGAGAGSR